MADVAAVCELQFLQEAVRGFMWNAHCGALRAVQIAVQQRRVRFLLQTSEHGNLWGRCPTSA